MTFAIFVVMVVMIVVMVMTIAVAVMAMMMMPVHASLLTEMRATREAALIWECSSRPRSSD
jgi:NADH:ubiquinone oxidoreductase subunit 3 (subunit A)